MSVVSGNYLLHSGGTKFYEIVTIANATAKCYVEIRRWGKADLGARGGGQIQILKHGNAGAMADSAKRQLQAKKTKGYEGQRPEFGFHKTASAGGTSLSENEILRWMPTHYADPDDRAQVIETAQVDPSGQVEEEMHEKGELETPKVPEADVDRGESWGSW